MRHLLVTTFLSVSAVTALAAGSGTGFFVSTSGHILTNAHVIDGAENILIQTGAGETSMARVLSVDASNDLALIKIEAQSKPLHIRSTEGLDKGAKVFTIGFPNPGLQGLEAKYTEGVISSFSGLRDTPNVMQVTVPIQPGNSGGPLIDDKGNVVGVVVSKINALAVAARQDYIPENVNFAVKSDYAIPLILGIPSAQRGVRRSVVSVRDVEAATVLIVTSTKDDATKQAKRTEPTVAPPQSEPSGPRFESATPETTPGIQAFGSVRFELVDAYLEVASIEPRSEHFHTTLRLGDRLLECTSYARIRIYSVDDIRRCRGDFMVDKKIVGNIYSLKVSRLGAQTVASIFLKLPSSGISLSDVASHD